MAGPESKEPGAGGPSPWSHVGLGFEIAVPVLLGVLAGERLDRWLGTKPWLLVAGALLGIAVGFYGFFRSVLPRREGR